MSHFSSAEKKKTKTKMLKKKKSPPVARRVCFAMFTVSCLQAVAFVCVRACVCAALDWLSCSS